MSQAIAAPKKSLRGTTNRPGADLARLPVGLDFRALNLIEGLRAAVAIDAIVLINTWAAWPPLSIVALAAFLTCLCDPGGPIGARLPGLLAFAVFGGLLWAAFGVLQPAGIAIVLPLAALAITIASFARVWGQAAAQVGSILNIVIIFALDAPLSVTRAAGVAIAFVVGGLWAVLLVLVVWRLHPSRPARRSVAEVWRLLAGMSGDLRALLEQTGQSSAARDADWAAHARAHRRAVRDAIEQARAMVLDTVRLRGHASPRANQTLIRLETGDQMFGALIALSDLLEHSADPLRHDAGRKLLRLLRPALVVVYLSIETDEIARPERLERIFSRALTDTEADPAVHRLAEMMADRLRVAVKVATEAGAVPDDAIPLGAPLARLRQRVWAPVAANLTWGSDMLRHAVRAGLVGMVALFITMMWPGPFQHWLPITAVLTMQPFFTATWQRALERVAGTVLGALVGSFLAFFVHDPVLLAVLMVPLAVLAFAVRQVSYGAFIACLTPWVMVFVEVSEPGHSEWAIAGLRAFFTLSGGLMAVVASMTLWPSWEPDRLRKALFQAIAAHARYADTALAARPDAEQARRRAGMASNNLEASLSRALHEPRRRNPTSLEAALVADATLRRVAGRLSTIQYDQAEQTPLASEPGRRWQAWIGQSLRALAAHEPMPPTLPDTPPSEAMRRIVRQIELLDGALRRFRIA